MLKGFVVYPFSSSSSLFLYLSSFFFSFSPSFFFGGATGCLVAAADGKTLKNASASAGLEPKCTRLRIRFTHF